jgi:hypothetical protein
VGVLEAGVGHPFDDVPIGADLGDVHRDTVGTAQAQRPEPVGVGGGEELLHAAVVSVDNPTTVELEGLPVAGVLTGVACPA